MLLGDDLGALELRAMSKDSHHVVTRCARCRREWPESEAEVCWYCFGLLCRDCWDRFGHCGHTEASLFNILGRLNGCRNSMRSA
jgi:hypothetical protein